MSLNEELENLATQLGGQLPQEINSALQSAFRQMMADRAGKGAIGVGDVAPDFELRDQNGATIRLSSLLAESPVVLTFYRGSWCPFCSLELRALQSALLDINGARGRLVAVSPQVLEKSKETGDKLGLSFTLLSDLGNLVSRRYGLVFTLSEEVRPTYAALGADLPSHNGDNTFELPVPATYVIARDGSVAHAHVDANYMRRLDPTEIMSALRKLSVLG